MGIAVVVMAGTFPMVVGLAEFYRREPFDLERTLANRIANWGGAVFVVVLGLLMLGVGVVSVSFFG